MDDPQYLVECPCGVTIREPSSGSLVAAVQRHALEVHQMDLDEQQVLDMARPV